MRFNALKAIRILFLLVFATPSLIYAQKTINVVTTAVPFLRISPDARAGGMGDVGIATLPDANSSFWNQAKIPFASQVTAVGATYTPWLGDITRDVYLASVSGYHQLDENSALSGSIRYFNLGDIQFTDFNGNALGSSKPREFSIDFGYSRKVSSKLAVGVALRYINSRLASGDVNNSGTNYKPGQSVSADISLYHNGIGADGSGLTYGVAITNLGTKIAYTDNAAAKEFIPANLGLGVGYTFVLDEVNKLSFALDANKLLVPSTPTDSASLAQYHNYGVFESWSKSFGSGSGGFKSWQFGLGAEYNYDDLFFARAGYHYEDASQGNLKYLSLGVGIRYNIAGLNFSYLIPSGNGVTRNPLSNTIRFGVTFGWDKK